MSDSERISKIPIKIAKLGTKFHFSKFSTSFASEIHVNGLQIKYKILESVFIIMQTLDNEITTKYDIFPDKMPKGLVKTSTELEEIINLFINQRPMPDVTIKDSLMAIADLVSDVNAGTARYYLKTQFVSSTKDPVQVNDKGIYAAKLVAEEILGFDVNVYDYSIILNAINHMRIINAFSILTKKTNIKWFNKMTESNLNEMKAHFCDLCNNL